MQQDKEVEKKLIADCAKITVVSAEAKKPMIKAAEKLWSRFEKQISKEYFTEIE